MSSPVVTPGEIVTVVESIPGSINENMNSQLVIHST